MKPDNDILKQVDRRSGMTVPDDYFANFARQMMQQLPEKSLNQPIRRFCHALGGSVVVPMSTLQPCLPEYGA